MQCRPECRSVEFQPHYGTHLVRRSWESPGEGRADHGGCHRSGVGGAVDRHGHGGEHGGGLSQDEPAAHRPHPRRRRRLHLLGQPRHQHLPRLEVRLPRRPLPQEPAEARHRRPKTALRFGGGVRRCPQDHGRGAFPREEEARRRRSQEHPRGVRVPGGLPRGQEVDRGEFAECGRLPAVLDGDELERHGGGGCGEVSAGGGVAEQGRRVAGGGGGQGRTARLYGDNEQVGLESVVNKCSNKMYNWKTLFIFKCYCDILR